MKITESVLKQLEEKNNYSSEYLNSVKDRFPEFNDYTNDELIDVFKRNEDRRSLCKDYEAQVDHALYQIGQEHLLNADDDLLHYIFGEMSYEDSNKIQSGINFVIQDGGKGDLILGSSLKESQGGWETTVGSPAFSPDFKFFSLLEHKDDLKIGKDNKILLILSVNNAGVEDSLGRKEYFLTPKLLELPSKNALLMKGMMFKRELTPQEFKENFEKISK